MVAEGVDLAARRLRAQVLYQSQTKHTYPGETACQTKSRPAGIRRRAIVACPSLAAFFWRYCLCRVSRCCALIQCRFKGGTGGKWHFRAKFWLGLRFFDAGLRAGFRFGATVSASALTRRLFEIATRKVSPVGFAPLTRGESSFSNFLKVGFSGAMGVGHICI